ncbi:MAG: hypothetical protein LBF85_08855 [Tannerella sp.]|jgi:hypothetical protein|nr:hypothetical protein [Tannerella sp.]
MKNSKELLRLAVERSRERFPQAEIRPQYGWYIGGKFYCTVYVGNTLILGTGESMNACCEHLLSEISRQNETDGKNVVRYEYQSLKDLKSLREGTEGDERDRCWMLVI